jgi:hypothetical protein
MKKIFAVLFIIILFSIKDYSQNNPFYAPFSPRVPGGKYDWIFSVDTTSVYGSWSYLTHLPAPLFEVNSYYWPDSNKIFVCGGADSNVTPQSDCYFYNLITNNYEPKASLPSGRWSGKLVRVRDSLYLIGSVGSDFSAPDGLTYRYSPSSNTWAQKSTMPSPHIIEPAVCVFNDSLIITIGGSTNGFLNTTPLIRIYNPFFNTWKTLISSAYPVNMSTGHAECRDRDSNIVVVGGYGDGVLNNIYRGKIQYPIPGYDSIVIRWDTLGITDSIWGSGIYRVAGGKWGDYMIFGPAMKDSATSNIIYGYAIDSLQTDTSFIRFLPNTINSAGNIATIAIKPPGLITDSNYFYIFGGYLYGSILSSSIKYSFSTPPPIGIHGNSSSIPKNFKLYQNYPNPFNPSTKIKFDIPPFTKGGSGGFIQLKIYDILGREIKTLVNEFLKPGGYSVDFDGANLSSGVYFYRLAAGDYTDSRKMILLK